MATATYERHQTSGDVDKKFNRKYKRVYRVFCDSFTAGADDAFDLVPVDRYDPYPTWPGALACAASAEPLDDQLGWYDVTVSYDTDAFEQGNTSNDPGASQAENPLLRAKTVKYGTVRKTKILTKDKSNPDQKDIVNSAKQPYDPPLEVEVSNSTITVSFYWPFNTDVSAKKRSYENYINDADYTPVPGQGSYPAKSLKCNEVSADSETTAGGVFWHASITFEYDRDGWNPTKLLDAGTLEYTAGQEGSQNPGPGGGPAATPNKWEPIKDGEGNPISTPVPLKDGKKLPAGQALQYLEFNKYDTVSFTNIYNP